MTYSFQRHLKRPRPFRWAWCAFSRNAVLCRAGVFVAWFCPWVANQIEVGALADRKLQTRQRPQNWGESLGVGALGVFSGILSICRSETLAFLYLRHFFDYTAPWLRSCGKNCDMLERADASKKF